MKTNVKCIIFFTFFIITTYRSEAFNHAGRHFFLALPFVNYDTLVPVQYGNDLTSFDITIASKHTATVQLHFLDTHFGNPATITIIVPAGEVVRYRPNNREIAALYTAREVVSNKSIEIISDSDIVISAISKGVFAEDGMELLPVDNQPKATRYRYMTYCPGPAGAPFTYSFSMVSSCDSTIIRITPACNTLTHVANVPFTITLNKGETYVLESVDEELSGTLIEILYSKVNTPICLYNLTPPINISPINFDMISVCCADALLEQILPADWWDTLMPVTLMYYQTKVRVRIMSDVNQNRIFFDNTYVTMLNAGYMFDTVIDRALVIHTSKPAAVAEFMLSSSYQGLPAIQCVGDPDMIWVTPSSQGIKEAYFKIFGVVKPAFQMDSVYHIALTIISPTANVNNIRFDNQNIGSRFQPFPGDPSWTCAHIPLDSTDTSIIHHIVSPQPITGHVVKVYPAGGYSFNLSEINVTLGSDTVYKCVGSTTMLSAPAGSSSWHWSTGDTSMQIYLSNAGHYTLSFYESDCSVASTLHDFYIIDSSSIKQHVYKDTMVCLTDSLLLQLDTTGWNYTWDDSSLVSSRIVYQNGIYTAHYYTPSCIYHTDTFKVTFYNRFPVVGNNFRDCNRKTDMVWAMVASGDTTTYSYTWLDSAQQVLRTVMDDNGDTFYAPKPGVYSITIQVPGGCSINIPFTVFPHLHAAFTGDSIICLHDTANFYSTAVGNISKWYWNFGDGDTSSEINPTHIYKASGIYKTMLVVLDTMPCTDTAYATIKVTPPPSVSFTVDKDSICVGEPVTLTPVYDVEADSIMWDINGSRNVRTGTWKHSFDKSGEAVITLTASYLYCKDVHYTDTVQVWPLPIASLRTDTSLCPNQMPLLLMNLSSVPKDSKYLWSTGERTASIAVAAPGTYWLQIATAHGCIATDTMLLSKSCYIAIPNVFSPNGDGVNDYFFPRDLLGAGISGFEMQIYNRWGEKIFETGRRDGRGWDGTLNGVPQGEGVFIYAIEVSYINGVQEKYKGNVTLLR